MRATKGRTWEGRARIDGEPRVFNLGVRKDKDPRRGINKTEAERELQKRIAAYVPERDGIPIFRDVADAYVLNKTLIGRKESTPKEYASFAKRFYNPEIGDKRIDKIDAKDIGRIQTKLLKKKASPTSVRLWMTVLHGFFEFARSEPQRYIDVNPCDLIERPKAGDEKEVRWLTQSQLGEVVELIPKDDWGKVERRLYWFAAMTGLRRGELIGLRWRHVDWLGRKIQVNINTVKGKDGAPKSGKGRWVPLPDSLIKMLEEWSKETLFDGDDDRVFTVTGGPLDGTKMSKRFSRLIRTGKIGEFILNEHTGKIEPSITFHSLRHSFAVHLAKNPKVTLVEIQGWMGHASIKTTMRYATFQSGESAAERSEETFSTFPTDFPHLPETTPDFEGVPVTSDSL